MGTKEFSDGFDVLLNSYANTAEFGKDSSNKDIVLNEYEKSLFLTEVQEDFVRSLYNGRNILGEGFEETEELRRYLSNLIGENTLMPTTNTGGMPLSNNELKAFFTLPLDLWFITYESVHVTLGEACGEGIIEVKPTKQDEYHKLRKNPFRGITRRRALRFDLANGLVEIISKFPITDYYVRYLKRLSPIILEDLPDGLMIDGQSTEQTCKLPTYLHQRILELAVKRAFASKRGTQPSQGDSTERQ